MKELSLHLLDIIENSISARADNITVEIIEDTDRDCLKMSVLDDGKGMDAEMLARVTDPFVTSRTTRKVGLGIPLLKAAAEACNGRFDIHSEPGKGTRVSVEFQRSHIDRAPLGDLANTFLSVVIGSPQIHWVLNYQVNSNRFEFDDQPIKDELKDIPLSDPEVIKYLRNTLKEGINSVQLN
ncbi:MAG: ATP-binding protein [Anaerolineae bacterium]|nr:ATP-binding protein [Anaerolineae bacterium]